MAFQAAVQSWDGLPDDLISAIARCLPCPVARFRMSRTCSKWRTGVLRLQGAPDSFQPPTPLSWLLLPYRRVCDHPRGGIRVGRFFCVLCGLTHRTRVPLNTGGARFFGAYQGGWVFIAYRRNSCHALINLHLLPPDRPAPALRLPDALVLPSVTHRMVILAATLSAPPVPSKNCVVAAISVMTSMPVAISPKFLTVWRMGSLQAALPQAHHMDFMDVDDVIYHDGAFYFIDRESNLLRCVPNFQEEAPLEEELKLHTEYHKLVSTVLGNGVKVLYLVESRGKLLMVARLRLHPEGDTSSFRVFQMMRPDTAHALYSWHELPALDGRMLFVGRGCSRSYEVADFPGLRQAQEGVYFHDECLCNEKVQMICDDRAGYREYPCSDNGIWSAAPSNVDRLYTRLAPSTYSSPVWFLH